MIFIIILHVIVCTSLIAIILIQRGRGSGLVESFQGAESIFGTKTDIFLTRTTTILSILFFFTCLSMAILSVRQSRSLMKQVASQKEVSTAQQEAVPQNATIPETTEGNSTNK
ncbi:MAG: preprotein translocase subunit SecG [Candidatus Omnitrophica bacterium]|nr:preprotein translocase subunit SecG [Candidatus Omnitrophota bacterium]